MKRDICDGGLYALSDGHRSQNVEDIDPSTIRDVTPPRTTTVRDDEPNWNTSREDT